MRAQISGPTTDLGYWVRADPDPAYSVRGAWGWERAAVVSADAEASDGGTGEGSDAASSARSSCHERTSWVRDVRVIRNPSEYVYEERAGVLAPGLLGLVHRVRRRTVSR